VLIAPLGERFSADLSAPSPPTFAGRLALGDPTHVPAGLYAQQALKKLGWWAALQPRLAPAADVRVALTYVERGECGAGLVYATDARISSKIAVLATLPDSLHEPIVYPLAIVVGRSSSQALHLLSFLRSVRAAAVFKEHGFKPLIGESADAR
jgi:molybdate transport system substrate-binding protein